MGRVQGSGFRVQLFVVTDDQPTGKHGTSFGRTKLDILNSISRLNPEP
jgi:hypothetical protein